MYFSTERSGTTTGVVVDAGTGLPISGVYVVGHWELQGWETRFCGALDVAVTNSIGVYELRKPALSSSVKVSAELTTFLIFSGADVNLQDIFGWTPLMYAASFLNGQPEDGRTHVFEAVRTLLNHGADIGKKNKRGQTALDLIDDRELRLKITRMAEQSESGR